jgi:hypothetical protein
MMPKNRESEEYQRGNEAALSVEELEETDQALEAATVEGLEDAADHPERPVHTHLEYGRPDDLPPARFSDRKKAS